MYGIHGRRRYGTSGIKCVPYGEAWNKSECVKSGSRTLKDATNEAIRTWAKSRRYFLYHWFSRRPSSISSDGKRIPESYQRRTKKQILEKEGRLPDCVLACVGGGSNSIGMFAEFIDEKDVELIGVEAAGFGIETGKHASAFASGKAGVLHGMRSYLLQDDDGNIQIASSISAGLDYPGVGPEHAYLHDSKRATYVSITDDEAMQALKELCREEGIIPAIESAHAIAYALKKAKTMNEDQIMVSKLSGRGDKDVHTIAEYFKEK